MSLRYDAIIARMKAGEQIMIDGGTGTEVERRGVPQLENAWNGGGALSHPDIVRGIHRDYIEHGAEVIISNTFATSRNLMQDAGCLDQFEAYNRRGVELAREARAEMGNDTILVAGGISHWSFSGRLPSLDALREGAAIQAAIMQDAGVDLIMLEMMIEIPRMLAVHEGASQTGLPIWAGLSCAPGRDGVMRLQNGVPDEDGHQNHGEGETLADAITALNETDVPLLNIMHTDVMFIDDCLDIVERDWDRLVGVYAHSGAIIDGKWGFEGTISPEEYCTHGKRWLDREIHLLGGCCGIRPDHIQALRPLFAERAER